MATEYESIDVQAIRDAVDVACGNYCSPIREQELPPGLDPTDVTILAVLSWLQADGRLITGAVETEYSHRLASGGALISRDRREVEWSREVHVSQMRDPLNPPPSESLGIFQRTVTGWLPVSDVESAQTGDPT